MTSAPAPKTRHEGTVSVRVSEESQRLLRLIAAYERVGIRELLDGIVAKHAEAWQRRKYICLDAPGGK